MNKKIQEKYRQYSEIKKIVFNCGIGKIRNDPEAIEYFEKMFENLTGQKPKKKFSKRMIAGFNLLEKTQIGFTVTLRKNRMYETYHKLVSYYLPSIYSFKGLERKNFDHRGNFTFGIRSFYDLRGDNIEHLFKFIKYRRIGFSVSIITHIEKSKDAMKYIKKTGFLFKSKKTDY